MSKESDKKTKDAPVFNLRVRRDTAMSSERWFHETSRYIGEFVVYNSGRLERSFCPGLHTHETGLGSVEDHLHIENITVGFSTKAEETLLLGEFKIPHFTLGGLYSLVNPQDSKKEELLTKYIKKFNPEFEFNSIATNERTRIKLLERAYKEYVSEQ